MEYRCLLWRVNAGRVIIGQYDTNLPPIFERPKLFKPFGQLKKGRFPAHEIEEEIPAKPVNALVTEVAEFGRSAPGMRNEAPGKIERVPIRVDRDLDDIGVLENRIRGFEGVGRRDHRQVRLGDEVGSELVNQGRVDQGFIPLDIDDMAHFGEVFCDLGCSIGAAGVISPGQGDMPSKGFDGFRDALIVCCHCQVGEISAFLAAIPDMLDEWFSRDEMQRFSGKTGGSPAGRDYTKNGIRRSFHGLAARRREHPIFHSSESKTRIQLNSTPMWRIHPQQPLCPVVELACLDLEGVLIPEIWINVAKKTGIEDLMATTRDIPDYDVLMKQRLRLLAENGLKIQDVQEVIDTLAPLDGAKEFLGWLKARFQVVILSDTFYEFADPLMRQLDYPTLFCHKLGISETGEIEEYHLRMPDQKREAVKRFHELNFKVIATGDSYNDTTMLSEADRGILFRPPQNVIDEFPQFPVARSYEEAKTQFLNAQEAIRG